MANLYTSNLEIPVDNFVTLEIDEIDIGDMIFLKVLKYSSEDILQGEIVAKEIKLNNETELKTNISIELFAGSLQAGEKIQLEVNN